MSKNDKKIDLASFVRRLKWRRLVKWAAIGASAGTVIALSLPREYVTTIEFAPENTRSMSSPLSSGAMSALSGVAGLGNMAMMGSYDGVSMRIYPRIIRSTPYLMEFYDMQVPGRNGQPESLADYLGNDIRRPWWSYVTGLPGMAAGWLRPDRAQQDETAGASAYDGYFLSGREQGFCGALRGRTNIDLDEDTWTVKISARMQNPLVAALVADSMMTTLQRYMTAYFQTRARASLESTQKIHDEAFEDFQNAQRAYAEAADSNRGLATETAKIRLERLRNEYQVASSVYGQMASQLASAKLKLREDNHIATILEPAIAGNAPASTSRKMIIIAYTLLFAAGYVAVLLLREYLALFRKPQA